MIHSQNGLFQTVGSMPEPELRDRTAALAKFAALSNLPVIAIASIQQGPNGPKPMPASFRPACC